MIKKVEVEKDYQNKIIVNFCLTLKCNYSCWYCYQKDWDKESSVDYKDCINFLRAVKIRYPEKEILVSILGGEALFYKDIDCLLLELHEMDIKIDITTNGSKNIKWWKKFSKIIDNIAISYHHNEVSTDTFFNMCKTIIESDNSKNLSVSMMVEPKYFDEIYEFGYKIVNNIDNIIINMKVIKDNGVHLDYSPEQKDTLLKKNKFRSKKIVFPFNPFGQVNLELTDTNNNVTTRSINQTMIEENNKFRGWNCYAGIETFYIDHKGEIFGSFCQSGGSLGNISGDIKFRDTSIICDKDICDCRGDICVTKFR